MNTVSTAIILTLLSFASTRQAYAQALLPANAVPHPYSDLKTLAGYQPSVIASEQDAQNIYNSMPTSIFEPKSECSERAEYWAYRLFDQFQLSSMKVMILFTDRYKREFGYVWDFHIAPLIPVKMADGSIQDQVFDPTFTRAWGNNDPKAFDNKPISIQAWSRYFVFPDADCLEIDNYDDFVNFQDRAYCYVMKAPMYNYIPNNFLYVSNPHDSTERTWYDPTTKMRIDFWPHDLKEMKKGLK